MALTRPRYSQIYDTDYKQSVKVATTADVGNILAGGNMTDTVDNVSLAVLDRILVKDQTDKTQNGIYRVITLGTGSNGTWERTLDASTGDRMTSGMTTIVERGDTHAGKTFRLTTADPITVGTTELTFTDPFVVTASAAGANTEIQFADTGGIIGASSDFTFDKATALLTVTGNISAGNINSTNGNIANLTSSNLVLPGTLTIGSQQFIAQGNDGFSVNENFNIGNATITGYHYTSGAGRQSVAFTLARTGAFTNGFGITGTASDNKFVIGGEFGNTAIQFKKSIGMPFNVAGGTTLFEILPSGNLTVYGNVIPSANVAYSLGSETNWWKDLYLSGNTIYIGGQSASVSSEGVWSFTSGSANVVLGSDSTVPGNITVSGVMSQGTSQYVTNQYVLHGTTTDNTETEIFINNINNYRIPVTANVTISYQVDIVARRTDAENESASWHLKGVVDNFSGTTSDVGDVYEVIVADDDGNLAVDARADNTTDSINIYVYGVNSKDYRWVAMVKTIEVLQ